MTSIIQVVGIFTRSHTNMRKGNILIIKPQHEQLLFLKILTVKDLLAIENSTKFDRKIHVRGSTKKGDMKPKDWMECLDINVLKKHGLNVEHVKNDPMFFLTMLCPICPPSAIQGD
jgi:hypothetical protein